jgi:hypothetical protein
MCKESRNIFPASFTLTNLLIYGEANICRNRSKLTLDDAQV